MMGKDEDSSRSMSSVIRGIKTAVVVSHELSPLGFVVDSILALTGKKKLSEIALEKLNALSTVLDAIPL